MTDPTLLDQQQRLLTQLQREARERGEIRTAREGTWRPAKRFNPTQGHYVRTFEQWNRQQIKALLAYPWTKGMGAYD